MGEDALCVLGPDTNDCGDGETCQCVKFRFQCTQGDEACTESEQKNKVTKSVYTSVGTSVCQYLKTQPSVYQNVVCCTQKGCNQPDNVKCSASQARRRAFRKLANLLDV